MLKQLYIQEYIHISLYQLVLKIFVRLKKSVMNCTVEVMIVDVGRADVITLVDDRRNAKTRSYTCALMHAYV